MTHHANSMKCGNCDCVDTDCKNCPVGYHKFMIHWSDMERMKHNDFLVKSGMILLKDVEESK